MSRPRPVTSLTIVEITVTLASLIKNLQPKFSQLEMLDQVFSDGVVSCEDCGSCSQRAAHLLSTLYDSLLLSDSMGQPDNSMVRIAVYNQSTKLISLVTFA